MKIKVNKQELLEKMKKVEKITTVKELFVIATEKEIQFQVKNVENVLITFSVAGKVIEAGKSKLNIKLVNTFLKNKKDTEIEFSIENDILKISSGKSSLEMISDDNLANTEIKNENISGILFSNQDFIANLNKVKFATDKTDSKNLNIICVDFLENKINFVGTDSYRLAIQSIKMDNNSTFRICIPTSILNFITEIGKTEKDFTISESGIFTESFSLYIEQQNFVKYENLANSRRELYNLQIDKKSLSEALSLVGTIGKDAETPYQSILEGNKDNLKIRTNSSKNQINEFLTNYTLATEQDKLKIALNTKMLFEALKQLESETANIIFGNSSQMLQITENEFIYIQMPLAIRDI